MRIFTILCYIMYCKIYQNSKKKIKTLYIYAKINILFVKSCFIVIVQCVLYGSLILPVFHCVASGGIP